MIRAFKPAFEDIRDAVVAKSDPPAVSASTQPQEQQYQPVSLHQYHAPTSKDILRYRYQHGTNVGGIFILEQWLFGSMYDQNVSGSSELDAITASINVRGLEATRQKWEAHWSTALTDADIDWLATSAHCNAVRLPIGYFTLGPMFCFNTAFQGDPSQVYANAWTAVKQLICRCFAGGIGVLIDLHGLPGGANHEMHSGTSTNKAELWGNGFYLDLATRCLLFIAEESARDPQLAGVIGIQVCNEAIVDPPGIYEWYNDIIQRISATDASIPLYLSDGWDLGRAVRFTRAYNNTTFPFKCPVIIDTHKYWTFDEKDTSRSPFQIIDQVRTELDELNDTLVGNIFSHQSAVQVFVGEYSLALAPQSWGKAPADQKDQLMKQFGLEQNRTWRTKACGSAFWTFKMEWMPGWEWGFKASTDNGQIEAPSILKLSGHDISVKLTRAEESKLQLSQAALDEHTGYWNRVNPNTSFEHWRYKDGWDLGWADSRDFFAARANGLVPSPVGPRSHSSSSNQLAVGADFIGALELWTLKRMREAGVADPQKCPFGWEFEHGFRRAIRDFANLVSE